MGTTTAVDEATGRKYFLDQPEDLKPGEPVTFILNLHGGGSVGQWQHLYFPAHDFADRYRLVVATPSCATKQPMRLWIGEADDAHLRNIVDAVVARYGAANIARFWLAGHSQGGMTSNRLLNDKYWQDRVDGWLSLSGGRIGPIALPDSFFGNRPLPQFPAGAARPGMATPPDADFSFIFTTGELEMVELPQTSPWADKYGAGPRVRGPDIIDDQPGQVWDTTREGNSTPAWGLKPRPGVAQQWSYPGAAGGRVVADVVRLDKGHTEGLEPNVTEALLRMMVGAPGGKIPALA
jgi:hypothetical protein